MFSMKFAVALIAAVQGESEHPDDEWIGPNWAPAAPVFQIQPRGRKGGGIRHLASERR